MPGSVASGTPCIRVNLMSNLPYSLSNNNVPKDFDIFSPVFCATIAGQCYLRKSCKWANAYLQYQYVLYILYAYQQFI
jgi:hypothetical protein